MTKTKLPRYKIRNLFMALQVSKSLDVPSKFRYAINRNLSSIEGEIKATQEAFPEPDITQAAFKPIMTEEQTEEAKTLVESKIKEALGAHAKWAKEIDSHMKEEIEVELYLTDLIEINDTINVPIERRAQQNQALIDALMPIFKE